MAPRKAKPKKEVEEAVAAGYPSARRQPVLVGHAEAVRLFADSMAQGRPAQSWLITGPEGVGKATFAFHLARRVLAMQKPGDPLPGALAADHLVSRRVAEGSHTDLLVVQPEDGKNIPVDAIREVQKFVHLTAAESAWRVVIVDPADAMNANAANALLKILEEPPQRCLMLLVSHLPGRLLPTIRSRCRQLGLKPLAEADFDEVLRVSGVEIPGSDRNLLYRLSLGSPGVALQHHEAGTPALHRNIMGLLARFPSFALHDVMAIAEGAADKNRPLAWPAAQKTLLFLLHQLVMAASGQVMEEDPGEAGALARVASSQPLDYWLELWENTGQLFRDADVLHLDHKQVVLDVLHRIEGSVRV